MRRRTVYAWGVAILSFVVLMIVTPAIPQSQEYHDFADQREFFGIPNTLNVVSNFPFLVIGVVVCKVNYGVGLVFSLVWLLLELVPRTIISSQMMLDLCGIDCRSVFFILDLGEGGFKQQEIMLQSMTQMLGCICFFFF
ncbi:hypothetical protein QQP08_007208 [Theobroma cacao]|nr:hypothetical protein QQP08_007208 [Theobroma cacao]